MAPPPGTGIPDGAVSPASGVRETVVHASCVAVNGRAVFIRGSSGSGKSGLALSLMAFGAGLVADDRVRLWRQGEDVIADTPTTLSGRIEARQVGILPAPPCGPAPVRLIVDMDKVETERLPPRRSACLLGVDMPVARKSELQHFPAAILHYLIGGRDE